MTVSTTTKKAGPYTTPGTGPFTFDFKVFAAADLRVVKTSTGGVESDLTLTTHYTVALNADQNTDPGGSITLVSAIVSGEKITIVRAVESTQPLDLATAGGFYPEAIEDALDRTTILVQQIEEQISRALLVGVSTSDDPESIILSDLVAAAASAAASAAAADVSADEAAASAASINPALLAHIDGTGANTDIVSMASPALAGATATTQAPGNSTTKVATTAFVTAAVAAGAYTPPSGSIVQTVYASTGSVLTGTTRLPMDDTIPQQAEGVEAITVAVTPTAAGNNLLVEAGGFFAHSANSDITLALFRDGAADAIGAAMATPSASDKCQGGSVSTLVAAGGTALTTFKLRVGSDGASGTITINGRAAGRLFGGAGRTWIKVTEIKA